MTMEAPTAVDTLLQGVYIPTFLEKCAAAGISFRDESELNAALETVAMLKAAKAEAVQSGVDVEGPSAVKQANELLKQAMLAAHADELQAIQARERAMDPQILAAAAAVSGIKQAAAGVNATLATAGAAGNTARTPAKMPTPKASVPTNKGEAPNTSTSTSQG